MIKQVKNRQKNGFTLAELLVVVAIIGILVAISIPIFTAQRAKAVRAVNQANIRAAKAAAVSEIYSGEGQYLLNVQKETNRHFMVFKYDVKEEKIVYIYQDFQGDGSGNQWNVINAPARGERDKAVNNQKCDFIYVYVEPENQAKKNGNKEPDVQTAPYYNEDGTVGALDGANPFGPRTY